jgi:RND family efflux transporter MFP subunit
MRTIRISIPAAAIALLLAASACEKKMATVGRPPPEVTFSQPVQRDVVDHDEFTGRVAAHDTVDVRARVRGSLEEIHFTDGQEVKAGEPLFLIDPKPFEADLKSAEANVAIAESEHQLAEAKLQRMEEALKKNAIPGVQVIEQRAQRDRAKSSIDGAKAVAEKARLDLGYTRITAPISGKAGRALIGKGNLVNAAGLNDVLLTTIQSMDPIYVYFDIDERTIQTYAERARKRRAGAEGPFPSLKDLAIPFEVGTASEEGFPHKGVIDFGDNQIDPSTGTIQVRGVVENKGRHFAPGYYARVRVTSGEPYQALLVTERAIGTDQGQKYLLAVGANDIVEKKVVKLGRLQEDGLRVIAEGISPTDRIVVNGIQRARPGSPVRPKAGPMPTGARPQADAPRPAPAAAPIPTSPPPPAGPGPGR